MSHTLMGKANMEGQIVLRNMRMRSWKDLKDCHCSRVCPGLLWNLAEALDWNPSMSPLTSVSDSTEPR